MRLVRKEVEWAYGLMGTFADPGKEMGLFPQKCWRVSMCVCVFKFLKIEI